MIRATLVAASAMAALAACGAPVADTSLAGLDLNDARVVNEIARRLPAGERAAFATYALVHWPGSTNYCGRPIGQGGRAADTVGEAVAQTLKFEADLARTRRASRAGPATPGERLREQRMLLTDRIEQLVLEHDRLYARLGAAARTSPEAERLEREMQRLQARRAAVDERLLQASAV